MNVVRALLDALLGGRLERQTEAYLKNLALLPEQEQQRQVQRLLEQLAALPGPHLTLGYTLIDHLPVSVPMAFLSGAFSMVTGATGSGKTRLVLLIIAELLDYGVGFGVIDGKGDLAGGTLALIASRLRRLRQEQPAAAAALYSRISYIDFACKEPVSSYNFILPTTGNSDTEYFCQSRAELLMSVIDGESLSVSGSLLLQYALRLLIAHQLPITALIRLLLDAAFRDQLAATCPDQAAAAFFRDQFPSMPKSVIAALSRRISVLMATESIRLALSGPSAPNFRQIQDENEIVIINCFGPSVTHAVRKTLLALTINDIHQAVYAREQRNTFWWAIDEAQVPLSDPAVAVRIEDLLCTARSFASFFCFLTQNMTASAPSARMLQVLYTNLGWCSTFRTDPRDAAFLKGVLPISGRREKPKNSPFDEPTLYAPAQERELLLDEVAQLPARTAWLWLKSQQAAPYQFRTGDLVLSEADQASAAALKSDASFGRRLSRSEYDRWGKETVNSSPQAAAEPARPALHDRLAEVWQKKKGKRTQK